MSGEWFSFCFFRLRFTELILKVRVGGGVLSRPFKSFQVRNFLWLTKELWFSTSLFKQSPSLALLQVFMKMERAQQALPVETLPPGSHSSELLRTGGIGRTCGIRKQLRPLEKNKPQRGTLPNTGPGRRDSPHPATEAQLGAWVQLRLSAQQVGDQTNKHTFQDHSSQKIRVIFWNDLLPLISGDVGGCGGCGGVGGISAETEWEDSVTGESQGGSLLWDASAHVSSLKRMNQNVAVGCR